MASKKTLPTLNFLIDLLFYRDMRQGPTIITLMTSHPKFLQPVLLHKMLMTFGARKHPLHIMYLFPILHYQPPLKNRIIPTD